MCKIENVAGGAKLHQDRVKGMQNMSNAVERNFKRYKDKVKKDYDNDNESAHEVTNAVWMLTLSGKRCLRGESTLPMINNIACKSISQNSPNDNTSCLLSKDSCFIYR